MEGGQELNDTTLFGEHIYLYDILIKLRIMSPCISCQTLFKTAVTKNRKKNTIIKTGILHHPDCFA